MSNAITYDKDFKDLKSLPLGEYENCTFTTCALANVDLSNISFTECEFKNSDLSMAKISKTGFRDVAFNNCKLLGLRFDECNAILLSFKFTGCLLNFSSFYKLNIKNTLFQDCKLEDVEFTETNLTKSSFKNCDLEGAVFESTILEKVDFRTSHNFSFNPEFNRITKAKFSTSELAGLLGKYDIIIE